MENNAAEAAPAPRALRRIIVKHPVTKANMHFDVGAQLDFKDVTNEEFRVFTFPDAVVRIDNPALICVKAPPPGTRGGGSLRIIALDGTVTYVPYGWVSLKWKPREGFPTVAF